MKTFDFLLINHYFYIGLINKKNYIMQNYIMWPSTMRNRTSVVRMRIKEGAAGYGVYVMILEQLREAENYRVHDDIDIMAFAINVLDTALIDRVLHSYDLFKKDENGDIYSQWLIDSMANHDASKQARTQRAQKAAAARYKKTDEKEYQECLSNANAMHKQCTSNANSMQENATFYINKSTNKLTNKSNNRQAIITELHEKFGCDEEQLDYILSGNGTAVTDKYINQLMTLKDEQHNMRLICDIIQYYGLKVESGNILCHITKMGEVGGKYIMELIRIYYADKEKKFKPEYGINYILTKLKAV